MVFFFLKRLSAKHGYIPGSSVGVSFKPLICAMVKGVRAASDPPTRN